MCNRSAMLFSAAVIILHTAFFWASLIPVVMLSKIVCFSSFSPTSVGVASETCIFKEVNPNPKPNLLKSFEQVKQSCLLLHCFLPSHSLTRMRGWVCVCALWDATGFTCSRTLHRVQIQRLGICTWQISRQSLVVQWFPQVWWCFVGRGNGQYYASLIVTFGRSFSQHPTHSWLSPWLCQKWAIQRENPLMTERRWIEAEASGGGEGVSGGCSFIFIFLSA